MALVVVLAFVVAVVAAIRSTWSPCGVSMLSTITPLAERSRGRRYRVTVGWFVAGAIGGGLCLGALACAGAVVVRIIGLPRTELESIALVAALAAATLDSGLAGPSLPHHRRQVNEVWLDRYRGWVYGVGFGVQIGSGVATYIMTAAVYLAVVLAALSGSPLAAISVGGAFGAVRGLAVLAGARIDAPQALARFHRSFEAWRRPVARITVVVECATALALAAALGAVPFVIAALLVAIGVLSRLARPGAQPDARAVPSSAPAAPGSLHGAR